MFLKSFVSVSGNFLCRNVVIEVYFKLWVFNKRYASA